MTEEINPQTKDITTYHRDQESQGLIVTSNQEHKADASQRTTIRIQISKREMWLAITLTETLGGQTTGKSYRAIIQRLFKSLIASRLKDGTIDDVSDIEALEKLNAFQSDHLDDPGDINFESFEELATVEQETQKAQKEKIHDALTKVVSTDSTQDLDDLFPLSSPPPSDESA